MDKKERHKQQKKEYNSKLSSFQISKDVHLKVKNHCNENGLVIRDFLEKVILSGIK